MGKHNQYSEKIAYMFGTEDSIKSCRNVTFIVTDSCQLKCSYCYQTCKGNAYMTEETAKQCVDLLFDMYDKDDKNAFINKDVISIVLEFIGGEPLLNIDIIEYTCNYFWMTALERHCIWADTFRISMISNGEMYFDDRVQSFIKKYKGKLEFSITIDGDKEMHDSCRVRHDGTGNWEQANNAQMHYHEVYGGYLGTKVTISPENLKYLNRTVKYFVEQGYKEVNANPIYEHEWTLEEGQEYYRQLKDTADYILGLDEEIICSLFQEYCGRPQDERENMPWCGGSGLMLSFDTDGKAYPCLRYTKTSLNGEREPIVIGDCKSGIYNTKESKELYENMKKITRRTQSTDECFYCEVGTGCGSCTAWCYQKYGTMDKRDNSICWMHKARSLANVYYWNNYYRKNNIDKIYEMHLNKADAIKLVGEDEYSRLVDLSVARC